MKRHPVPAVSGVRWPQLGKKPLLAGSAGGNGLRFYSAPVATQPNGVPS